jgi:AraC-like DNA-binding protein
MDRGSFTMRRCALPHIRAVEAHSRHSFPRHTHEEYGIGVIVRGAQRSWSGRGQVEAGPGNLITCNPGEVHDGMPIGGARAWKMLYLAPQVVREIVADIREGAEEEFVFVNPVIDTREHARAFLAAYGAMTASDSDAVSAQERVILLLARLLQRQPSAPSLCARELARAKSRIDDDPAAPITLAELAREADMSRFQTVRAFTRLTGLTPHAYILQRRLDVARSMIARGATLADASAASGFADQSHFNRTFVRRYGLTPGAFADAMR